MRQQEYIYQVRTSDGSENYFGSLSAIYEVYTKEEIGCRVEHLWNIGVSDGFTYQSRNCSITKRPLYRKSQTRRKSGGSK